MALTDKLTNIANAIRAKTGKSEVMTLEQMVTEIDGISGAGDLLPADYPDYVRVEAQRVASEVRKVLKSDSIVCVAMSDTHFTNQTPKPQTDIGDTHAVMAAKALTHLIPIDFFMHTGDVSAGRGDDTLDRIKGQIEGMVKLFEESSNSLPMFICIGNHDVNVYYHDKMIEAGNTGIYTTPGDYLFNNFTKYSDSDDTVFSGEEYGGYCYRDFPEKKLRVIMLNSMDHMLRNVATAGTQKLTYYFDRGPSEIQRAWVAGVLQDLNNKADASEWGFVVMCHYPMDYGDSRYVSSVFKEYVNGGSITLLDTTYNFSGKNSAKFICQFHGHIHNFLTDKLSAISGNTMVQYNAWRIAIPNGEYNRENTYANPMYNISFHQPVTYSKVPNTEKDVSFVVNVINRSEEKIYSFAYGACSPTGERPDRVIGIGSVTYYSISKSLQNATLSNEAVSIEEGKPYKATLTLATGCELKEVTVTMGGEPCDCYSGGVIDIPAVTGNISIIVKAQAKPNFRNLVPLAVNSSGASAPYTNGMALSNSGSEMTSGYSGFTTTGYIPVKGGYRTLRIAGDSIFFDRYGCVICFYDASFNYLSSATYTQVGMAEYWGEVVEEDNTALTWIIKYPMTGDIPNAKYIRVSVAGKGENLIVTEDQEISYGGDSISYFVTEKLTNVVSSNSIASIGEGEAFTTTLTGATGYTIKSVTVTMDGTDITNDVYVGGIVETDSEGSTIILSYNISIPEVTGDIVITANGITRSYYVDKSFSMVTGSNNTSRITHGSSYTNTLTVNSGYKISSVKVTMGGTDITSSAYNSSTGVISISTVTGDIVIIATAIAATYSVTYNLTNAASSNTSTAVSGSGYTTTLTSAGGIKSVTITMGGTDITSSAYNSSTGVISIGTVTGDIIITAEGRVNLLTLAIDTDGSLYNGGKGYKSGYRLSTSDGGDRAQSGMYASGFIPIADGETLLLNNVGRNAASSSNGYNESYLIRYYALKTTSMEGQIILKDIAAQADGSIRITAESLKLEDGKACKYIRLSCSYLGDDTTIFVE